MIELQKDGGLWRVTLNRPDKANSLNREMLVLLLEIAGQARDQATVLIISGAGKVFSAGADFDEVKGGLATDEIWEQLSGAIADLPCLTIAALNGTLAGGAFGMALACDMRLSVPSASFFYPVMKLGYLPQPTDPKRLANLIGPARAKMILLAGQKIDAGTALDWGLVDRLVDAGGLDRAAWELAETALNAKSGHAQAIKELF